MDDYPKNNLSETLRQGLQFKKNQKKTNKTPLERAVALSSAKGVESLQPSGKYSENFDNNYIDKSKQLLNDDHFKQDKITELKQLQDKFNSTLDVYKTLQSGLLSKTSEYIEKSKSPYLNKNIKFQNGEIDYVTATGVRKKYSSTSILNTTAGKNGCPVATDLSLLTSNNVPSGIQLGSSMIQGQSCGNEGKNVRVTTAVNNNTSNYIGCYRDTGNRALPAVIKGGSQSYSQQSCAMEAIKGGYKYYGLQNGVNGNSQCFAGTDLNQATQYGISTTLNSVKLWSTNTANGQRNVAKITRSGTLTVTSPSGQILYTSPNAPGDCINEGKINSIVATYGGNCNWRPLNIDCGGYGPGTYNVPYGNANNLLTAMARQNPISFNYIAANGFNGDPAYCCAKKFDYSYKCGNVTKSGRVTAGQNINFNCNTEYEKCVFYLTLQNDGNMCIYRGTDPNNNKGAVWFSMTNGKQQDPNSEWTALKGKSKTNYLSSNMTLNSGEWIGSTNGSLLLYMQSDGNLVLYTSSPISNCTQGSDGKKYGGGWTNAVYEIAEQGYPALVGKVGYINEDAILSEYPKSMINADGSIKNSSPSCSKDIQNIDSIKWKNYAKSSQQMYPSTICGLSKELEGDNMRITELRESLRKYASQIIENISYLESLNINIIKQMGIDKSIFDANLVTYQKYKGEFSKYTDTDMKNINGILSDSNINVSYENYTYIIWSILAISMLLVTLKIIRK